MADHKQSASRRTTRRHFLAATGVSVGTFQLAGCTGDDGPEEEPGADGNLVMTTSSSGTTAYAASQGIAAAIEDQGRDDVFVDARPSEGTDANVGRLNARESDIVFIQNWTAARIRAGEEPFDDLEFQPCQVFHLYNLPWIFATANPEWTDITDVGSDDTIVPTQRGSGTRPALEHGLSYAIDGYETSSVEFGELGSALNEGTIDAAAVTILNSDIEPGWLQEMKGSVDTRLLDWPDDVVEQMRNDDRLQIQDVDMSPFDGYDYAPDTIPSITLSYNFIVRHDLNYDALYAFLEAMWEDRDGLDEYNALLGYHAQDDYWVTDMYEDIPFHPAAADFYEEVGVWRDEFERYEE